MTSTRTIVFAYSEVGAAGLEALLHMGVPVVGVITHPDNPSEKRWFRSVRNLAQSRNLPVLAPADVNASEVLSWVRARKPSLIFSFYFRQLLSRALLDAAPLGAYNLHGSLLPKYRGRCPVNWALILGETETGVTLHAMTERPDAGAIAAQRRVPIALYDTARTVAEKLAQATRPLLEEVFPLLARGGAPCVPQAESEATTFGARRPEDGAIDWRWTSLRIYNWVRALTDPFPGAFTWINGRKLFVWWGVPGEWGQGGGVPVATGDGTFLLQTVQWEGGPVQKAEAALNEHPLTLPSPPKGGEESLLKIPLPPPGGRGEGEGAKAHEVIA